MPSPLKRKRSEDDSPHVGDRLHNVNVFEVFPRARIALEERLAYFKMCYPVSTHPVQVPVSQDSDTNS